MKEINRERDGVVKNYFDNNVNLPNVFHQSFAKNVNIRMSVWHNFLLFFFLLASPFPRIDNSLDLI